MFQTRSFSELQTVIRVFETKLPPFPKQDKENILPHFPTREGMHTSSSAAENYNILRKLHEEF
jgi:hypothetical protein